VAESIFPLKRFLANSTWVKVMQTAQWSCWYRLVVIYAGLLENIFVSEIFMTDSNDLTQILRPLPTMCFQLKM